MDIAVLSRALRRWKYLIVLIVLIAGATSAIASMESPKTYLTGAVALVTPKPGILPSSGTTDFTQVPSLDSLVETYVGLVNTTPVRQRLVSGGIPRTIYELQFNLSAVRVPNTTLINITVTDRDPTVAMAIARNVVPAFNAALDDLQSQVGASTSSRLDALVPWDLPTSPPASPYSPDITKNVLFAVVGALVLAVALAFFLERLDNTVKSEADIRTRLGLTLVGTILNRDPSTQGPVETLTATNTHDALAEQYRALRTNLLYSRVSRSLETLIVTSTIPGEGKTTTACNLSVVMAQAGNKVILVDADFRRPALHRLFGDRDNVGLGNLILGDRPESECIQPTSIANLSLVCAGQPPPNPSELLGSARMTKVLQRLTVLADIVILDTPPLSAVTDAAVLGAIVQGAVLVVERGGARVPDIMKSIETLQAVGSDIRGAVLNRAHSNEVTTYYYYGTEPGPRTVAGQAS